MNNIKGIVEISGFGKETEYEKACQQMLQQGWEWLQKHPKAKLKAHTYEGIYGFFECDSKDAKALSEAVTKNIDGGCTGAMHQAVMQHLFYIYYHGIEKWKKKVTKDDK
jgi:hypothetical protein